MQGFILSAFLCFLSLTLGEAMAGELCSEQDADATGTKVTNVEYSARVFEEGYRFSIEGVSYELIRTLFTDAKGRRRFAVTHPALVDARDQPGLRDFFVKVETRESDERVCNDVLFRGQRQGQTRVHPVSIDDESTSAIRFGDLDRKAKSLESTRTLAATLRVRVEGMEMDIATGFSSQRSLNISDCAKDLDDSFGYVEYGPGKIKVACFPADPKSRDYVDEIDWRVDYQWPRNPPALLDQLIDYVYVEAF